jgi:myo-inositol-1(or 4)-monophosphatase
MMSELNFIKEIILEAGDIAKKYFRQSDLTIERKSAKDLVTRADKEIEQFVLKKIEQCYPEDSTLGEEYGSKKGNHRQWIIDPIDGTSSYAQGQPFFSISIGLYSEGEAICGAVYAPILNELFTAEKGKGAFCNGEKISVNDNSDMAQAMLSTGFACLRSDLQPNNVPFLNVILPKIRDLRRYGSAAMDLCFVASGRLDGYWELNLKPYDVAAGKLILQEAGGIFSNFDGVDDIFSGDTLATNGLLHKELTAMIRSVLADFK